MKSLNLYRRHLGGLDACRMQAVRHSGKEGAILGIVMVTLLMISILVLAMYHNAYHSQREAEHELKLARAFWLAEAGVQWCISDMFDLNGNDGQTIGEFAVDGGSPGTFEVVDDSDANGEFRISIGRVTVGGRTIERRIRIGLGFLPDQFMDVIRAENLPNAPWNLMLSGNKYKGLNGPRVPLKFGSQYPGGNDVVIGNLNINGSMRMYDESYVDRMPAPNKYGVMGVVNYSGDLYQEPGTRIAGGTTQTSPGDYNAPDLYEMDYANNHDYDIADIFDQLGISSGRIPADHPDFGVLHDRVIMNPPDRLKENASTSGDDFYFESTSGNHGTNTPSTGETPLELGNDVTYYVEGHTWFHKYKTFGLKIDGQAVIVSTADIHLCDNLTYADRGRDPDSDLLVLVALGEYSGDTHIDGTGNIRFGDPAGGTLFTCDAFMFANNDFLYNTWTTGFKEGDQVEPESGFRIFGSIMAMNRVVIKRNWYKPKGSKSYRAAERVKEGGTWKWKDIGNGTVLSISEIKGLRHYAMQVEYDDRIRDAATALSGLPKLPAGTIFAGMTSWAEIPSD